jgi:hypothetical protein
MKAKITTKGTKLIIGGFSFDGGEGIGAAKISGKSIDLTPYAGRHVRIWLDQDGRFSLNPRTDHFWQLAEFDVPGLKYTTTQEIDPETKEVSEKTVALPLDLSAMEIRVWELPA